MRASYLPPLIAALLTGALYASATAAPDWGGAPAAPGTSGWAGNVAQPVNVAQLHCQESAPYQVYFGSSAFCVGATSQFALSLGAVVGTGVTIGQWSFQLVGPPPANGTWNPGGAPADVWVRGPPTPHGTGCVESVFRGVQQIVVNPHSSPRAPLVSIGFNGSAGPLPCTGFPP